MVSEAADVAETIVFVGVMDNGVGEIEVIPAVRVSLGLSLPRISFVFIGLVVFKVIVGALSVAVASAGADVLHVVGVVNVGFVDVGS